MDKQQGVMLTPDMMMDILVEAFNLQNMHGWWSCNNIAEAAGGVLKLPYPISYDAVELYESVFKPEGDHINCAWAQRTGLDMTPEGNWWGDEIGGNNRYEMLQECRLNAIALMMAVVEEGGL